MVWLVVGFTGSKRLLAGGVLGDGLGAFADSVLSEFTGQEQTDGCLDFSASDGGSLVVVGQSGGLGGDSLEDVVDKAVHDGHGLAGHSGVGVHLLQDFVDVDGVGLPPPPVALLVSAAGGLCLAGGLLGSFGCWLGWHVVVSELAMRMKSTNSQIAFK